MKCMSRFCHIYATFIKLELTYEYWFLVHNSLGQIRLLNHIYRQAADENLSVVQFEAMARTTSKLNLDADLPFRLKLLFD